MACSQSSFCMTSLKRLILSISPMVLSQALYRHRFSEHYSTPSVCTSFPSEPAYTRQTSLFTIILGWQCILLVLNSTFLSPNHLCPNVTITPSETLLFTYKPTATALRSWTAIQKAWIKSQICVSLRVSPCLSEPQFPTLKWGFLPCLVWRSCDITHMETLCEKVTVLRDLNKMQVF